MKIAWPWQKKFNAYHLAAGFLSGWLMATVASQLWPDSLWPSFAVFILALGVETIVFIGWQLIPQVLLGRSQLQALKDADPEWKSLKRLWRQAPDVPPKPGDSLEVLLDEIVADAEFRRQSDRQTTLIRAHYQENLRREASHPGRNRFCAYCGVYRAGGEPCVKDVFHPPLEYEPSATKHYCDICGAMLDTDTSGARKEPCDRMLHQRA